MSQQPQIESPLSLFYRATTLDEEPRGDENLLIQSQKTVQKTTSQKAHYKRYPKPPYTYVALITTAIMNSPERKMTCEEIQNSIEQMFPFFRGDYKGWKSSARHALSQQDCFIKEPLNAMGRRGKPYLWSVDISKLAPNVFMRKSSTGDNDIQYASTLHDELGLPEIELTCTPRPEQSEITATVSCHTGYSSSQNTPNDTSNPHSILKILHKEYPDHSERFYDRAEATETPNYHRNDYNVFNLSHYDRFYPNTDIAPQQSVPNLFADFQYASYNAASDFYPDLSHRLNNLETHCQWNSYNSSDVDIGTNPPSFNHDNMYLDINSHYGYSLEPVLPTLPHSPIHTEWDHYLSSSPIDLSRKRKLSE